MPLTYTEKIKRSRQSNINIEDITEQAGNVDIENEILVSMELKRVVEEINKLDFTYREVLSLFYLNEMSPREISVYWKFLIIRCGRR